MNPHRLTVRGCPTPSQICALREGHKDALDSCAENFFIHEIFDEFNEPWEKEIVTHPVEVVDGYIEIPDRPGLGIDLNVEEIARHPYRHENSLPLFQAGWERRRSALENEPLARN